MLLLNQVFNDVWEYRIINSFDIPNFTLLMKRDFMHSLSQHMYTWEGFPPTKVYILQIFHLLNLSVIKLKIQAHVPLPMVTTDKKKSITLEIFLKQILNKRMPIFFTIEHSFNSQFQSPKMHNTRYNRNQVKNSSKIIGLHGRKTRWLDD